MGGEGRREGRREGRGTYRSTSSPLSFSIVAVDFGVWEGVAAGLCVLGSRAWILFEGKVLVCGLA